MKNRTKDKIFDGAHLALNDEPAVLGCVVLGDLRQSEDLRISSHWTDRIRTGDREEEAAEGVNREIEGKTKMKTDSLPVGY